MGSQRTRMNSLRPFVKQISELAAGLPTTSDIETSKAALDDVIAFLQALRTSLENVPTVEANQSIAASIRVFDKLLDTAEANSALGLALGLAPKRQQRATPTRAAEEDQQRGRVLMEEFRDLTVDQIRERLSNSTSLRLSDLRALAAHMHVKHNAKSTRDSLAQALTARIANSRAYDALGSGLDPRDE